MHLLTIIFSLFTIFTSFSATNTNIPATESVSFAKCAMPTFESEYKNSKVIFVGTILSERKEGDDKVFTFQVEKYWKGKASKTVEVSYYENMHYQAWFKVGNKYLVYAKGNNDGALSDNKCSWTKDYSAAKDDLKRLGKGKNLR